MNPRLCCQPTLGKLGRGGPGALTAVSSWVSSGADGAETLAAGFNSPLPRFKTLQHAETHCLVGRKMRNPVNTARLNTAYAEAESYAASIVKGERSRTWQ